MAYAWKITWAMEGLEDEIGVSVSDDWSGDWSGKSETFALYDDDEVLYYKGIIVGDYDGFEPLDDFGMPNAGCTGIKYDGEWL